jgi:hypothetical protein
MSILKSCNAELCPILAYLSNESLSTGVFPDALKIAKVVPIFKIPNLWLITDLYQSYQTSLRFMKNLFVLDLINISQMNAFSMIINLVSVQNCPLVSPSCN